jgi:hypothetical protein
MPVLKRNTFLSCLILWQDLKKEQEAEKAEREKKQKHKESILGETPYMKVYTV